AQPMTAEAAERFGEVVVVSSPLGRYREVPTDAVEGKVVIDTNNYYPQRDGHIPELDDDSTTSSELLQRSSADFGAASAAARRIRPPASRATVRAGATSSAVARSRAPSLSRSAC